MIVESTKIQGGDGRESVTDLKSGGKRETFDGTSR